MLADLHVDTIYEALAHRLAKYNIIPYTLTALVSRLYVDMERFDDEREEMQERGMGVVYTRNHNMEPLYDAPLSRAEMATRKMFYYRYHRSFEHLSEQLLHDHGALTILDLHSYATNPLPYELHSDALRTPLILGTDAMHSRVFTDLVQETVDGDLVSENTAFRGTFVPLRYYQQDDRVHSIMAEVRKDVYLDEQTFEVIRHQELFDRVVDVLEQIVVHAIQHMIPTHNVEHTASS